MKKAFRFLSAALALAMLTAPCFSAGAADGNLPKRITFATFPMGSGNYSIGNALAKVASQHSGILVVTRPGSGASAWVGMTNDKGSPELGIVHIFEAWWAFSGKVSPVPLPGDPYGTKPFYQPNPNLRLLIAGPRQWVSLITEKTKPWKTVADAKGATLAGGFSAHFGAYSGLVASLSSAGLDEKNDFKLITVPTSNASVKAFGEGRADVALASAGTAVVSEANANRPVRFLNIPTDPEAILRVKAAFPGAEVAVCPKRVPGIEEETTLIAYPMAIVGSIHMTEETAYALTKTWWEHYQETWAVYKGCEGWSNKDFVIRNATIPYHDGAIRFFKEVGAWDADMDARQAELLAGKYPFLK